MQGFQVRCVWGCPLLDFETRQRVFVREKLRAELSDLGIEDADELRQQLREVLADPCNATVRVRFRNLVQRFSEEFMMGIAELDGIEPLDWWRSARWALTQCGMGLLPAGVLGETPPERRAALARHFAMAARNPVGGACYAVTNACFGEDPDDPSYGPLLIDGWLQGDSPTISICIGTECVPAEPVHVLDAFLAPMRMLETSTQPRAAAAERFLARVIDGAIRQLERQFEEEFLFEVEAEHRARGISA